MRYLMTILLFTLYNLGFSQKSVLIPDATIAIPTLNFDSKGDLIINASPTSSAKDFDYLIGNWKLKNRKLKSRLTNSTEWIEFESKVAMHQILEGNGNIDKYTDTASGQPYEGVALRLFNSKTKLWSIYWADNISGTLDPPVVGSFENKIGHFFGKDTYNGKKIIVVFRWDVRNPNLPVWSQAFSVDNGKTWEWNSINVSEREVNTDSLVTPRTFLPKLISTDSTDFGSAFSPDGKSFYFSRAINKQTKIYVSKKNQDTWSEPVATPFSTTKFSDADPAFSPNGDLYFISNRPRNPSDTRHDYDIWKVSLQENNKWSTPINVKELNSEKDEYYISFAQNGNAYFSSSRAGGFGEEDIYCSEYKKGSYQSPQNLGNKINTEHSEYDPFVFPDELKIIFASSGRQNSLGKADLYWSIKDQNVWIEPIHFSQFVNTPTRDYCPYIPKDGKLFFYSSEGDVKFIELKYLPKELSQKQ